MSHFVPVDLWIILIVLCAGIVSLLVPSKMWVVGVSVLQDLLVWISVSSVAGKWVYSGFMFAGDMTCCSCCYYCYCYSCYLRYGSCCIGGGLVVVVVV